MGAMLRLTIWSTSELMLNRAVTADVTRSAENNGTVINKAAERFVSPGLRNGMRRYPDYGNAPHRTMNQNFGIIAPDSCRDDSNLPRAQGDHARSEIRFAKGANANLSLHFRTPSVNARLPFSARRQN